MEKEYKPIDSGLRQEIASLVAQKKAVTLNYITDLLELLSSTAIIKQVYTKDAAEYIELATGEDIRLDRIVRLNGAVSPAYSGYDFGNSCSL